ncbi:MAG TPA: response regulator [Polyangiaceae bacterium]
MASLLGSAQHCIDDGLLDRTAEERPAQRPLRVKAANSVPTRSAPPLVLVIDDASDRHGAIVECLQPYYQVLSAFDGREGLQMAMDFRPMLMVTELMTPAVNALELIGEIRRRAAVQTMSILVLTASANDALLTKLLEDGVDDFLKKPFSERELLIRVRNMTAQVRARIEIDCLRVAAESANRAKDEFLAMLGHELRNPLSPILTALQLMKLQGPDASARARSVIERQVTHLTRLVDDLLDVSRLARGKVELKTERLEMADIVAKAIEMASPLLEQRNHRLTVELPRHGLKVNGDAPRLSQAVSNLLTNAAKYTPAGGNIGIRAEKAERDVILSVHDSGIGIAPEVLPHIFDLFIQERQTIDRSQGGLGLGLSIVRNLIERHGGKVTARSEGTGRGSEFIVQLPLVVTDTEPPCLAVSSTAPSSLPIAHRILIVDDNEDGAEMLAEALAQKGCITRVAHDGPSALDVASYFLPDVAFLDIGLPVMDGYELASQLRAIPGLDAVRLIAVTGYGQESDREKSLEAGFHHHLVKPVDLAMIDAVMVSG